MHHPTPLVGQILVVRWSAPKTNRDTARIAVTSIESVGQVEKKRGLAVRHSRHFFFYNLSNDGESPRPGLGEKYPDVGRLEGWVAEKGLRFPPYQKWRKTSQLILGYMFVE